MEYARPFKYTATAPPLSPCVEVLKIQYIYACICFSRTRRNDPFISFHCFYIKSSVITHWAQITSRGDTSYANPIYFEFILATFFRSDYHIQFLQGVGCNLGITGGNTKSECSGGAKLGIVHVVWSRDADGLDGGRERQGLAQCDHCDVVLGGVRSCIWSKWDESISGSMRWMLI